MGASRRFPAVLVAGALCVALAGGVWALFAHELYGDGHAPTRVLPPFDAASYYRAQAWFITPALLGLWALLSLVAFRLTGGSRGGAAAPLAGWLGVVYGGALLVTFVGPEWVLYRGYGIEGLRTAVRYTAPVLAGTTWLGAAVVLRLVRRSSLTRATTAAFAALLVQAVVGAPLLR